MKVELEPVSGNMEFVPVSLITHDPHIWYFTHFLTLKLKLLSNCFTMQSNKYKSMVTMSEVDSHCVALVSYSAAERLPAQNHSALCPAVRPVERSIRLRWSSSDQVADLEEHQRHHSWRDGESDSSFTNRKFTRFTDAPLLILMCLVLSRRRTWRGGPSGRGTCRWLKTIIKGFLWGWGRSRWPWINMETWWGLLLLSSKLTITNQRQKYFPQSVCHESASVLTLLSCCRCHDHEWLGNNLCYSLHIDETRISSFARCHD